MDPPASHANAPTTSIRRDLPKQVSPPFHRSDFVIVISPRRIASPRSRRAADRTLTGEEVNAIHQEFTGKLVEQLGLIQR